MTVGSYELILRVSLVPYGIQLEESFDVFVDDCVIIGLSVVPPSTVEFMYDVLPSATTLIIPRPSATIQPQQCAFHGVLYTWNVIGFNNLPNFAVPASNGLQISTTEASFADSYILELTVEANGPSTV